MYPEVVAAARECVGKSHYRFWPEISEAPHIVNCYTFVTWAFWQDGILLPNCLRALLYCGIPVTDMTQLRDGDLVFTSGLKCDFVQKHESRANGGVGHVILAEADGTGIHACSVARCVVQAPLSQLLSGPLHLRGIYRLPVEWYRPSSPPLITR